MRPLDQYKEFLPEAFNHSGNDDFFDFIDKLLYGHTGLYDSLAEALPLMSVTDSQGGWLDIIGEWARLKRPNVAFRNLADGEVLFQNEGTTSPTFNSLHSLSTDNPGVIPAPVEGTYFPSILAPTEDLMKDAEYSALLIAYQSLKFNGDTLPNIMAVLDVLLSKPYALTTYTEGKEVRFQVADDESFGRIVAVQTLFEEISGDGLIYVIST